MDWPTIRAGFRARLDDLNAASPSVSTMVENADRAMKDYIAQTNDKSDAAVQAAMDPLHARKAQYQTLQDDIVALFTQYSSQYDLNSKLRENGTLQTSIQQLQKVQREIRTDVETAVARDELLRSHETETTSHSLFLSNRPIRKQMVPYLWVLAVFFVGVGLLFFHRLAPSFGMTILPWYAMVTETLLSSRVLLTVLAACILTVVVLSLKVAGVF